MVGGGRLRHSSKVDVRRGGKMGSKLAGFTSVYAAVVSPEVSVSRPVGGRVKGKDRDGCLLAVAVGEAEVLDDGLVRAVRASVDVATGSLLSQ